MKIVIDACSIILLTKSTIIEKFLELYDVFVTEFVFQEVMLGKDKMFEDALLMERLEKEEKFGMIDVDKKLMAKLIQDFNIGSGEASVIAVSIKEKNIIVATDNNQGRKVSKINNLSVVGSIEILITLYKKKKISYDKAINSLKILKEVGWFNDYLIEKAMADLK